MILGIDPSLTSTGLALVEEGAVIDTANIKSKGHKGMTYDEWLARIERVHADVRRVLNDWTSRRLITLAVIEAPSHGSKYGNPHERAGLWWRIYSDLKFLGIERRTLAPTSRAKYITGSGKADKKEVLAVARDRWGEIDNHDIADAVGLAMWGEELDG